MTFLWVKLCPGGVREERVDPECVLREVHVGIY